MLLNSNLFQIRWNLKFAICNKSCLADVIDKKFSKIIHLMHLKYSASPDLWIFHFPKIRPQIGFCPQIGWMSTNRVLKLLCRKGVKNSMDGTLLQKCNWLKSPKNPKIFLSFCLWNPGYNGVGLFICICFHSFWSMNRFSAKKHLINYFSRIHSSACCWWFIPVMAIDRWMSS